MNRITIIAAVFALAAGAANAASTGPYKLDAKGKCHSSDGKFAKQTLCTAPKPVTTTHCRDKTTKKFAKCGAPNTEPVPTTH